MTSSTPFTQSTSSTRSTQSKMSVRLDASPSLGATTNQDGWIVGGLEHLSGQIVGMVGKNRNNADLIQITVNEKGQQRPFIIGLLGGIIDSDVGTNSGRFSRLVCAPYLADDFLLTQPSTLYKFSVEEDI